MCEVLQRFDSDVDADLVAELEAVSDCLRGAVYLDVYAGNVVLLNTAAKARIRKMNDPEFQTRGFRPPRLCFDSHPDFERILCGQIVEAERCDETNHSSGNKAGGLRKAVMLGQNGARKA
jgi:hypothetical protein